MLQYFQDALGVIYETRDARLSLLKEFHKTACVRGRTKWGKGKVQNFRSVLRLTSMIIGFIFF